MTRRRIADSIYWPFAMIGGALALPGVLLVMFGEWLSKAAYIGEADGE